MLWIVVFDTSILCIRALCEGSKCEKPQPISSRFSQT
jgi:hypothetical protein